MSEQKHETKDDRCNRCQERAVATVTWFSLTGPVSVRYCARHAELAPRDWDAEVRYDEAASDA